MYVDLVPPRIAESREARHNSGFSSLRAALITDPEVGRHRTFHATTGARKD